MRKSANELHRVIRLLESKINEAKNPADKRNEAIEMAIDNIDYTIDKLEEIKKGLEDIQKGKVKNPLTLALPTLIGPVERNAKQIKKHLRTISPEDYFA